MKIKKLVFTGPLAGRKEKRMFILAAIAFVAMAGGVALIARIAIKILLGV